MHTRHVLHNRDAMTPGFYQPLPPTTCVVDKALSHCVRHVPVEVPDKICGCSPESLRVSPGKTVAVITMNEMKMAAPGLSCQAFSRMLDQRTVRFGRTGKISTDSFQKSFFEWEAVHFEVDKICKEEPFICPACTPYILAVSVDGNRKLYRFKNAARSEEQAIFEDVFIAKDEDVTRFVDYIHKASKHVKSSGAYQDGAGLTLGEEVEQCNAFLSRIAVTTKHMSKAGCTDMLTLMAMRWNQQKFNNLATALSRRYQKTMKALQSQLQNLEFMKVELTVTESQLEDWVNDVKEWADATTTTTTNDVGALASRIEVLVASIKRRSQRLYKDTDGNKGRARVRRKIREEKGILTSLVEKYNIIVPKTETLCLETILSDTVDLRTKRKAFDIIMSLRRLQEEQKIVVAEMNQHWKYLSTRAETLRELSCLFASESLKNSQCGLSEEGLKGLQSIIHRNQCKIRDMRVQARDCYLHVLSGAENINFLNKSSADDYDSESDFENSDDEL
ncbi:hypothetical protein C0J45_8821 [Silurus meridionalis]|nr:hypothetical protein C0J45_8821 [Silurus meridionalis]